MPSAGGNRLARHWPAGPATDPPAGRLTTLAPGPQGQPDQPAGQPAMLFLQGPSVKHATATRPTVRVAPSPGALRPLLLSLLLLASAGSAAAQTAVAPAAAAASVPTPTLRAEVAKPLQAVQDAIKAANYPEAAARLAEAEAMPGLTPYEAYLVQRLKAPVLFGQDKPAGALATFETVLASPLLPAAERAAILETTIKLALQLKDYPRASRWMKSYAADGGGNAEIRRLYPQVLSVTGDHAGVVRELAPQVAADDAAKRVTPEASLRLLAGSQNALKDSAGYLVSLEKLAASTGKPEYWGELIARSTGRDGFAGERLRIDIYRLMQTVGVKLGPGQTGDWAFRANQAGLPAEAQKLLDDGFSAGLLGKDDNAEADRKLREAATKSARQEAATLADNEAAALKAKDGNAAFGLGLSAAGTGAHERALGLMNQGVAKGGLRRPDDALLQLGLVAWRAGKVDEAKRHFAAVKGADGAADLARLWTVYLTSPARQ